MMIWHIDPETRQLLLDLPESGMGFQWVNAIVHGRAAKLLIMNGALAVDMSRVKLELGVDPSVILRNGVAVLREVRREAGATVFAQPQPHSFSIISTRIDLGAAGPTSRSSTAASSAGPFIAAASSLIKKTVLSSPRQFHRFSPFNPDHRIDPVTGDFRPGTYAVPESEVRLIPTGFAAVGRLALPSSTPASNHYVILAAAATPVEFGTVAPAFGQAGGGVEAFFRSGATNAASPPTPVTVEPDE